MPNNQTKRLAHGAMMIALFTVLIAVAFYVPFISIIATVFALLPIAWYSATYNRSSSIFVAAIAIFITFFIGGLLILPFSLIFSAVGVAIGDALRLKKSKVYLFISSSLTLLFTFAVQYLISLRLFEFDFIQDSMKLMRESYEKSIEFSENITGQTPISEENLEQMFSMMEMALPASITVAIFALTFLLIALNLPMLKRLGIEVPKFSTFKNLRLPRAVLWYYLIVLCINLFVHPEVGSTSYVITLNVSLVLWVLLTVQGVSFIHFTVDEYGLPKFIKVLGTLLAIPLYSFVILLGIIDLGFNVREFIKGKIQK
ncbi:YybS family protein [Solibacillus sp. FSL H8-0538]|uniref:YybS family protein n=1 Tax=Solibacillus sp. FSL H8-0538 TaxID=2921400 RepID=UPI0030F5371B